MKTVAAPLGNGITIMESDLGAILWNKAPKSL